MSCESVRGEESGMWTFGGSNSWTRDLSGVIKISVGMLMLK